MRALQPMVDCQAVLKVPQIQTVSLPGDPVKTSATWKGCERKRWIFLARATVCLSSSLSSSMPRIAMISCRFL